MAARAAYDRCCSSCRKKTVCLDLTMHMMNETTVNCQLFFFSFHSSLQLTPVCKDFCPCLAAAATKISSQQILHVFL